MDLNFPPVPHVSSEAKDLICQVISILAFASLDTLPAMVAAGIFKILLNRFPFLLQLLVKDSSKRLSLQKITEHPWITKNANPEGICN